MAFWQIYLSKTEMELYLEQVEECTLNRKKIVGRRLREARDSSHMSQADAAAKVGVHFSTLSKYESGEREADFETLTKLSELYRKPMDYLMGTEKSGLVDTEWQELYERLKAKSAEAEATMLLRKADTMTKAQIQDLLRVLEWHVKGD